MLKVLFHKLLVMLMLLQELVVVMVLEWGKHASNWIVSVVIWGELCSITIMSQDIPSITIRNIRKSFKSHGHWSAHVASTTTPFEKTIIVSTNEYTQFTWYKESSKSPPLSNASLNTVIIKLVNSTTFSISLSFKWVIDCGTTIHIIGNSQVLSTL